MMVEYNLHTRLKPASAHRTGALAPTAAWFPALFGILVICCESTRIMGAEHTMHWLNRLCLPLTHGATPMLAELNIVLRKSGHFFGYGLLGLVIARGWLALLLARTHMAWAKTRLLAAGSAVFCVAFVASMDELHQSFLPGRTACVSDVLLDTSGAVLLLALAMLTLVLQRKRMLNRLLQLRNIRRWQAGAWLTQPSRIS